MRARFLCPCTENPVKDPLALAIARTLGIAIVLAIGEKRFPCGSVIRWDVDHEAAHLALFSEHGTRIAAIQLPRGARPIALGGLERWGLLPDTSADARTVYASVREALYDARDRERSEARASN